MANATSPCIHILTGRVHPGLAAEVAGQLGVVPGKAQLEDFANGEIHCRLDESVRGNDVFIIQPHYGSLNKTIVEQALMIDAAKRASAQSVTAVCPYMGYARQDRKASGREPIAARLVVDILSVAGADRIMSVDLHSGQIQGFFDGPFDHMIAMPILREYLQQHFGKDLVIVSPDAGRVKLAERYSSKLQCPMAIVHKQRSLTTMNSAEARDVIGDIAGKTCVIIDDMVDTAGTLCAAAELVKQNGAKEIYALATHGLLSGPALKRIEQSAFRKVIVTNTVPVEAGGAGGKIEVVSVAPLIAAAIHAAAAGLSVSALFEGQNQI